MAAIAAVSLWIILTIVLAFVAATLLRHVESPAATDMVALLGFTSPFIALMLVLLAVALSTWLRGSQ